MPLLVGYSRRTFEQNLAELLRAGHERNSAIVAAASKARQSFFKRHPGGALPVWLAFPRQNRLARYYDSGGRPLRHNPTMRTPDLRRATALYKGFTGKAPRTLKKITIPALPETGLAIGKIFGIMYSVDATGERFHHEFKGKARPLLIVSDDGRQVFLSGGTYTFTKRGFVDRK